MRGARVIRTFVQLLICLLSMLFPLNFISAATCYSKKWSYLTLKVAYIWFICILRVISVSTTLSGICWDLNISPLFYGLQLTGHQAQFINSLQPAATARNAALPLRTSHRLFLYGSPSVFTRLCLLVKWHNIFVYVVGILPEGQITCVRTHGSDPWGVVTGSQCL